MTLSDPIADMLTRIRNACMVKKAKVTIPYSKMKHSIAETFLRLGFIQSVSVEGAGIEKCIIVELKYVNKGSSTITKLVRASKVGCREYGSPRRSRHNYNIPQHAISIWSTNEGVLAQREALDKNVGGEKLCYIW